MSNHFPESAPCAYPVFYRSYSRKTDGIRESWPQVVNRTVQGTIEVGRLTPEQGQLLQEQTEKLQSFCSGRWLWVGGTPWIAVPENYPGGYNCFSGETLVTTLEYGVVPISPLVGETVHVINANRQWVTVTFQHYGTQPLFALTLRRGITCGATKVIRCTGNHEWVLDSGERCLTEDLLHPETRTYLRFLSAPRPTTDSVTYTLGLQHGMVYGDGSIQGTDGASQKNFKIRLCGEKAELLPLFSGCSHSCPPSYNGDPIVYLNHKSFAGFTEGGNLKGLPFTTDTSYLLGFVRGLLATDGTVSGKCSIVSISGSIKTLLWLEKTLPMLGIETGTLRCMYKEGERSNFGVRKSSVYGISLYAGSMVPDDFLRSKHKENFGTGPATSPVWQVLDVQELGESADVFCCEEPQTHAFVLSGGILTGNCTSIFVNDVESLVFLADWGMQGCGTGAVLELPVVMGLFQAHNYIELDIDDRIGAVLPSNRQEQTTVITSSDEEGIPHALIVVGDSRQGWVEAYRALIELATVTSFPGKVAVTIDITHVRPAGEPLQGFGGVSNPIKLAPAFERVAAVLNRAHPHYLSSVDICLLIDEIAVAIVAGAIRRTAGMRQFSADDQGAAVAKDNLYSQDEDGAWSVDPERASLRMANHTRVFHRKPDLGTITEAVRKQYYSGEGAIQYAPEAIARSNADLFPTHQDKVNFIAAYENGLGSEAIKAAAQKAGVTVSHHEVIHRLKRYGLNPCGEICGADFFCDLAEVNTNRLDPWDVEEQRKAFTAAALYAASLLHHKFAIPRMQQSREWDPIVAVCPTGIFDHFVVRFGVLWLEWWAAGRPEKWGDIEDWGHKLPKDALLECFEMGSETISQYFREAEQGVFVFWREVAEEVIDAYCEEHNLKKPNRKTSVQPSGTKSLLTNASPGWHPPKGSRFIRRITFRRADPVALACMDYGYRVIPAPGDTDAEGNLLNDPFDPRCTEWLVEIPTATVWADLPGADQIDLGQFSALAQFDFYMQVQTHYTTFNTSATIELRETEIEELAQAIWTAIETDRGYISAALLARFDDHQSMPRLPFEPIDQATFEALHAEVLQRRKTDDFHTALLAHDTDGLFDYGPVPCDSEKCMMPTPDGAK